MPRRFRRSIVAANAEVDHVCAILDAGTLVLYGGTQPDSPEDELRGQPALARLVFSDPAFHRAVNGQAAAHLIAPALSADATGRATWFRAVSSDGRTVFDGSVGLERSDLTLDSTHIEQGGRVTVTAFSYLSTRE